MARLDPSLSGAAQLVWCTFLGGSREDVGHGVKLGAGGEVNLVGATDSTDFPLKNPYQATFQGGQQVWDAFAARLDGQGANLLYSTYLGGTGVDYAHALDVAATGEILLTGITASTGFPATAGAFQTSYQGGPYDAFVSILDPKQSSTAQLTYSTFFGGSGESQGYDVEWIPGANGEFIVGMVNNGSPAPVTSQYGPLGGWDCHIARMNPALSGSSQLVFLHAFGGPETEWLYDFDFGLVIRWWRWGNLGAGGGTVHGASGRIPSPRHQGPFR